MSTPATPRAPRPAKRPNCARPMLIYSDATTLILSVRQHVLRVLEHAQREFLAVAAPLMAAVRGAGNALRRSPQA